MKRVPVFLSAVTLLLILTLLPVSADPQETCIGCGKAVTWTGLSTLSDEGTTISGGHYIYDYPEDTHTWTAQKTVSGSVCIHIPEGKTLTGMSRLFSIPKNAALSIQGSGSMVCTGFAEGITWTSRHGGIFTVSSGGTLNIFGCSYGMKRQDSNLKPYNGGLIYTAGTVNVHGGTLAGTEVGGVGSCIFAAPSGVLNITGGAITGNAPAVCVQGKVQLSGDPQISRIQIRWKDSSPAQGEQIIFQNAFTGAVELQFDSSANANLTDGAVIGISDNAQLRQGTIVLMDSSKNVVSLYLSAEGNVLRLSAQRPSDERNALCQVCNKTVTWTALTEDFSGQETLESGHYYLDFISGAASWASKNIVGIVCLDLNGQTLTGTTRAFVVESDSVLNVLGTGTVIGHGRSSSYALENRAGGTILVDDSGTLNLYGGTLTYEAADGKKPGNGGVVNVAGIFNMYGGTVENGQSSNAGGNIFVTTSGTLNFYGGNVSGGTASAVANSIACRGFVTLAGNATANELYLYPNAASGGPALSEMLTIEGKYTGSVKLRLSSANGKIGMDIGSSQTADISGATITTNNSTATTALIRGSDLILVGKNTKAMVYRGAAYVSSHSDISSALAACNEPKMGIVLFEDVPSMAVAKDIWVDLNGFSIGAVTGAGTLYCMDSHTNDYNIADGVFGTAPVCSQVVGITPDVSGLEDSYLMLPETETTVSFHRVSAQVDSISLRPEDTGLYFTCTFGADTKVQENITSYGILLELDGDPRDDEGYTYRTVIEGNLSTESTANSILVYGIMKDTNTPETNQSHARMRINACGYVSLQKETLYGAVVSRNLQEQLEGTYQDSTLTQVGVDSLLDSLSPNQQLDIFRMYLQHKSTMENWQIPNIQKAAPADEAALALAIADQQILQERRQQVVAKMRQMGDLLWVADEDFSYTLSTGRHIEIRKGRLYRGMLYSFARTDEQSFLQYAGEPDENGFYHISGLTDASLNKWGYDARIGTDCGGSVMLAYKQIGASVNPIAGPTTMVISSGFLPVGDYVHQETADGKTGATKDVTAANGAEVMYAAYAKTQPGDILNTSTGSGGHSILIIGKHVVYNADGSINGEKSYLHTLEQNPAPIDNQDHRYDETLGRTVYTCFVEKTMTFAKAFSGGQLPVNCLELVDASASIAPATVTDTLDATQYSYHNLFQGTLCTNRMVSFVTMTITDEAGNSQSVTGFGIRRAQDTTQTQYIINNYCMANFLTEDPAVLIVSIDPLALEVGTYHCKVEIQLSSGEQFTPREFQFQVTQEDKTNPPVFLPQ